MRFPFIMRGHHEEVVGHLNGRVAALERELHRLQDVVFQLNFGVQLHDTLPVAESATATATATASVPIEADDEPTDPIEAERAEDTRRLRALARTRPSQLGRAMESIMAKRAAQNAQNAHPTYTVAKQVFENAKTEALAT